MFTKYLIFIIVCIISSRLSADEGSPYGIWGAGLYTPYIESTFELPDLKESDIARYDWLVVGMGYDTTPFVLNRLLHINPKQKYLIQLIPIYDLGTYRSSGSTRSFANFLDWRYDSSVRQEIERRLRDTIRNVWSKIGNLNSIVGFTFLEELPFSFTGEPANSSWDGLTSFHEHYRAQIEAERGKTLVWNEETKSWLGSAFVESLNQINKIIKEEAKGRMVFYWHGMMMRPLNIIPYKIEDIVKPGLCDGLMAYPLNSVFWQSYMDLLNRHPDWFYFSQLSHPGFMRNCKWEEACRLVMEKNSQNLGFFLYCQGNCKGTSGPSPFDDETIPDNHNTFIVSSPVHIRMFADKFGIGLITATETASLIAKNFPNPFRLSRSSKVTILLNVKVSNMIVKIYNVAGELVRTLDSEGTEVSTFSREAFWDGKNESGQDVATGLYVYVVTTDKGKAKGKIVLIR